MRGVCFPIVGTWHTHTHTHTHTHAYPPAQDEGLSVYRGETLAGAVQRLVAAGVVPVGQEAELATRKRLRRGLLETLVARRAGMLDGVRPFVHRAQVAWCCVCLCGGVGGVHVDVCIHVRC